MRFVDRFRKLFTHYYRADNQKLADRFFGALPTQLYARLLID